MRGCEGRTKDIYFIEIPATLGSQERRRAKYGVRSVVNEGAPHLKKNLAGP